MFIPQSTGFVVRWRYMWLYLVTGLMLSSFFLVACSGLNVGGLGASPTTKPTPSQLALAKLHWCNKPFILFRDQHAATTGNETPATGTPTATATAGADGTPTATTTAGSTPTASSTASVTPTPTTLTDWSQIEPNLGFTVFLPANLPRGTCLVSVSGTLHDPIFGGNFIIGYLLPSSSPLSLSEAPMRSNSRDFQCTSPKGDTSHASGNASLSLSARSSTSVLTPTASPTEVPILLCTGVRENTSIVFSARGSEASLKQLFDALQPNVTWIPM